MLVALCAILSHNGSPVCDNVSSKSDCGFVGIDQPGCESKGCCWKPAGSGSSDPWCFYKGTPGPGPSPAPPTEGSCFVTKSEAASPFTSAEIASMRSKFLANVNIKGSGAIVAAPDHNTGPGGDYYFHWERDGALTMISLQLTGLVDDAIVGNCASFLCRQPPSAMSARLPLTPTFVAADPDAIEPLVRADSRWVLERQALSDTHQIDVRHQGLAAAL